MTRPAFPHRRRPSGRQCLVRAGLVLSLLAPLPGHALTLKGPVLGVATNFGQHWQPAILAAARQLPVRDFRDEVYWAAVEKNGVFSYDRMETRFPEMIAAESASMSLLVNNGNPGYDDGQTPHSPDAIAAFARFTAKTVARFPAITSVEVGNEFNSQDFVSGPVKADGPTARAMDDLRLLTAVHDAVKAVAPKVRILGGGVHSIPVGFLAPMFAAGAARKMDALAIHTYTTPAEQLVRQIAVLRQLPGMAEMPIDVTEFGEEKAGKAPGHLLRNYCQMALSGVERAIWYDLNPRGDGMTPLIDQAGQVTPVGRTYRMISGLMEGKAASNAAPDPFTYACRFGQGTLVIWGAPRAVRLATAGLKVLDDTGAPLAPAGLQLSETDPLVITGTAPIELGRDVTLGPQRVLADSYDQYAYPGLPDQPQDPFDRYALMDGQRLPLETHGGQDRGSVPWTPYRGARGVFTARLMADVLLPSDYGPKKVAIVQSYRAPKTMRVVARIALDPRWHSKDGVAFTLALNGRPLLRKIVQQAWTETTEPIALQPGDRLSFTVDPNGNDIGDTSVYRFTLLAPPSG